MKSVDGAGVVITGAGRGIGAALARRFAAEGARVVVNDLDAAAAQRVAGSIGGEALPGDAASEDGVASLIEGAADMLDGIDLFCANAGIGPEGGPDAAEAVWDACWQVNVMAHVRAARLLTGPWLARGRGHLICTVSAAGLLTMLGSAPYSVTKHAALGFAEWMAASYAHRGITVQALCPMGVRTPLLERGQPGRPGAAGRFGDQPGGGGRRGDRGHRRRPVPDPAASGGRARCTRTGPMTPAAGWPA